MKQTCILMTGLVAALSIAGSPVHAARQAFSPGPVIEGYGPNAPVNGAEAIPAGSEFRIVFDTSAPAGEGELNRTLVSAARFINMHARAGVDPGNIHLAIVIHGQAVRDVAAVEGGQSGANSALVAALMAQNVEIFVCGQSAVYYGVSAEDLLPGVTMSLSAMTAHALLQQDGYTLNPF